jgi:hypothetical protein
MEATKDNNLFQFRGMTPNIWMEKDPARAVDGLTDSNNFKSFLSFRTYSQPYVHQQKTVPRCHRHQPEVTSFPEIWIGCLAVNDDKVFICLYDM